ncbi:hypothetical protein K2X85_06075 [bacterium]|jgi:hypothetical protein|nr:hypothetical protein [bacterium]
MFRTPVNRLIMPVLLVSSLVGCRAFREGGLFSRCSTCGSGAVQTVGYGGDAGSVMVGGDGIDGGSWSGDAGCTTCQKTPDVVTDGTFMEGGPAIVDGIEPLMLPAPDESEPSFAVNPTPDESPVKPEPAKPEPAKPEQARSEQPTRPVEVAPTAPRINVAKPSALNLDVKANVSSASVGQEIVFEITLANVGGAPVESIDLVANFSEGLRPKSVSPPGVSRIDGQRVLFDAIKSLAPMTLSYTIVAEAMPGMPESRLSVDVSSPILTSGKIQREQVVRLTP